MAIQANFPQAAALGFQTGKQMGGPSAMGTFIKALLANREKEQKFTEGVATLGIKAAFAEQFKDKEWKPQTKEEALDFERAKKNVGPWSGSGMTQLGRNKILGSLKAGYYRHPMTNMSIPLKFKEDAIPYIQQAGYTDYEKDPEIMNVLKNLAEKPKAKRRRGLGDLFRKKTVEERFEELVKETGSEEKAYYKLHKEGY